MALNLTASGKLLNVFHAIKIFRCRNTQFCFENVGLYVWKFSLKHDLRAESMEIISSKVSDWPKIDTWQEPI